MAYVVAQPCIGTKDRACVEVCPVQCFYENEDQLFIHPQECIDCDACLPACPVTAIFPEAQVPEEWKSYTQKAIDYFAENTGVKAAKSKAEVGSGGVAEGSTHWAWKGQAAATAKAQAPAVPAAASAEPAPALQPATTHATVQAETPAAQPPPRPVTEKPSAAAPAEVPGAVTVSTEAPVAPPSAKPAAKPAPKAAAPPPPKPMDPDEFRRIEAMLYEALEMLGGSRPMEIALFSEAEETSRRLKKEVTAEFGKEIYTGSELEKKGMVLRQKHELAHSLLQVVDRAAFLVRFRVKRRRFMQTAFGGVVTAMISALCGLLSIQTVRIDSFLSSPYPGLLELLRAFLNQESLVPFLAFQTIAGLLGLFTIMALYQCRYMGKELHELKRAMEAKQMNWHTIARLA